MSRSAFSFCNFAAQPLDLGLLGLHLALAREGLRRIGRKLLTQLRSMFWCRSRSRAACATDTPRSRTNRMKSTRCYLYNSLFEEQVDHGNSRARASYDALPLVVTFCRFDGR